MLLGSSFFSRRKDGRPKKTKTDERFTLLWVPTHGPSRSFAFSAKTLLAAICLLVVATAGASWFVATYVANSKELDELRYMRDVAEAQRQRIQELEEQIVRIDERLRQAEIIESQVREALNKEGVLPQAFDGVAVVASLDRTSAGLSSRGATISRSARASDMERAIVLLQSKAKGLEESMAVVEEATLDLQDKANEAVAYLRARPSIRPTSGDISSGYGYRRHPITRVYEFHPALDFAAPYGAAIKATADGTVTFSGYKAGYGRLLIIKHGYGFETLYAHCSRLVASYGKTVKRGDIIAYVGQTGTATGPHLHYEVRLNGKNVDPTEYLSRTQ